MGERGGGTDRFGHEVGDERGRGLYVEVTDGEREVGFFVEDGEQRTVETATPSVERQHGTEWVEAASAYLRTADLSEDADPGSVEGTASGAEDETTVTDAELENMMTVGPDPNTESGGGTDGESELQKPVTKVGLVGVALVLGGLALALVRLSEAVESDSTPLGFRIAGVGFVLIGGYAAFMPRVRIRKSGGHRSIDSRGEAILLGVFSVIAGLMLLFGFVS